MKLLSQFTVPASPSEVFPLFLDPEVMGSCIPGCQELVRVDERTFRGTLTNTVAHVKFNAGFSAEIVAIDAPREVTAVLRGEDRRLGSSIKVDAVLTVEPHAEGSQVGYRMELAIWGKLGRLGEPIVRRRTAEVERQFVEQFAAECVAATVPAAVGAGSRGELAAPSLSAPAATAVPAAGPPAAFSSALPPRQSWWSRLLQVLLGRRQVRRPR